MITRKSTVLHLPRVF